jgi:hypothetical protein
METDQFPERNYEKYGDTFSPKEGEFEIKSEKSIKNHAHSVEIKVRLAFFSYSTYLV